MKFIADGMLGKLTRWLRILGYDVKYSNKLIDAALIAEATKERRILLTRDLELYKQATANGIETFYVEGETGEEKLAEIAKRFKISLDVDMATSRCPKCNSKVKPTSKDEVADKVGKNTFVHYEEFWKCRKCGQVYWQGAHWNGIRKKLERTREVLETMREEATENLRILSYSEKTRKIVKKEFNARSARARLAPKATSGEYPGRCHQAVFF